jgi:segregation and condensation protein B
MDKNLVKIVGRAEVLGRPMLYGTTRRFLEVFGLNGIEDLPNVESLRGGRDANAMANAKKPAAAAQAANDAGAEQPALADPKPETETQPQSPQPEEPSAPLMEDSDPPPEAL